MHTLFALITLALAAAAFAWEGLCCLRSGNIRAAVKSRFTAEHMLFGDHACQTRQRLAQPLYLLALLVLLFGRVFLHASQLYTVTPPWVYDSMYLLYPITYTLLLIKFFFCTRYDLRQMLVSLCVFLLVLGMLSRSYDDDLFACMGFVLCFKDLDWRKTLACFAGIGLAFTAVLALLSLVGVLPIWYLDQPGYRAEFGYENPNHLSRVLMACAAALLLLLPVKKRRLAALWLLLPLFLFVSYFPRTRSVCLSLILLMAFTLFFPLFARLLRCRAVHVLLCAAPFLATACSYLAAVFYAPEASAVWQKIGRFSNGRLRCWSFAVHNYTPGLFGQELHYSPDDLVALDNSYLLLLYTGGILLFLAGLVLCSLLMHRLLTERRYWLALMWFVWLFYGAFEAFMLCPQNDFTVLLFAPLLFGTTLPPDGTPPEA